MLGRRERTGLLVLLAALAVVTSACFGRANDDGVVGPTVPPGSSTTTTTAVPSYDVPAVIDLAYVQRVVSAYDHALGDAIRVLVRDRSLSDEFLKYLVGLYTPAEFETQQRAWQEEVANGRIEKSADPVADPRTEVRRLVSDQSACVVVQVDRDYSPTLKPGVQQTKPAHDHYLVLVRKQSGR
ncbi:MAG: hypothetical protein QOF60_2870, partial [Actinomycetota bacterium]|nr:hypothetical protein [Actinomycetota bacterium]